MSELEKKGEPTVGELAEALQQVLGFGVVEAALMYLAKSKDDADSFWLHLRGAFNMLTSMKNGEGDDELDRKADAIYKLMDMIEERKAKFSEEEVKSETQG
jgi:hypothetical protein